MIRDIENHSKKLNEMGVKFTNSNFLFEFKQILKGFESFKVNSVYQGIIKDTYEKDNVLLISNYVSNDGGKYTLEYNPNYVYWRIDYKKNGSLNAQKKSYYKSFGWSIMKNKIPFVFMSMYVNPRFGGTGEYRNFLTDFKYDKTRGYSNLEAISDDTSTKKIIIDPVQQIVKRHDNSRNNINEVIMDKNGFLNSKVILNSSDYTF